MTRFASFFVTAFFLSQTLVQTAFAANAGNSRLSMRATGQFEDPTTVFYSVFVATRQEAIADVVISTAMPGNTRFLENVDAPSAARYEGVADNVIAWTIPSIEADTLVGPFTFRIRIDPARAGSTPTAPPFWVSYQKPDAELVESPGDPSQLKPLAESGSVTFDSRGTLNAELMNAIVAVGDTGIQLYAPEGAVTRSVTIRFERLNVEDDKMPSNAAGTWWCGLYRITTDPPNVEFQKTIAYALPTRRAITPGLTVRAFTTSELGGDWNEAARIDGKASSGAARPALGGFGFGGGFGGCYTAPFGFTACGCAGLGCGFGGFGGFGVAQTSRTLSTVNGATLTQQIGTAVTPAQITDGTSNIIAILIGIR